MLENYFARIESIITPSNYSKDNVDTKIQSEHLSDDIASYTQRICGNKASDVSTKNSFNQPSSGGNDVKTSSDGFTSEKQEMIRKMKKESQGKLENPESHFTVLSKESNKENAQGEHLNQNKVKNSKQNESFNLTDSDIKGLMEKVHALNSKNMAIRYDNEHLRRKVEEKSKENRELNALIEKYQQEKEHSCKYLLKLESMLQKSSSSTRKSNKNSFSNEAPNQKTINKIALSPLITTSKSPIENNLDKDHPNDNYAYTRIELQKGKLALIKDDVTSSKEVQLLSSLKEAKSFIEKILKENASLKTFQQEVYSVSKSYDDINENLREAIQHITESPGASSNADILLSINSIVKKVDETLQVKQKEYNLLLNEKDEQIKLLKDELLIISKELEYSKKDRVKDQNIFKEQENQIINLQDQLSSLSDNPNRHNHPQHLNRGTAPLNSAVSKKIEPAKKTVASLITTIEREFNLADKHTVAFLETISKKIK